MYTYTHRGRKGRREGGKEGGEKREREGEGERERGKGRERERTFERYLLQGLWSMGRQQAVHTCRLSPPVS